MEGDESSGAMPMLDCPPDSLRVVIVGGGFSGTMVAAELARRGISSILVEGSGREGLGTAYSTPEEAHLLNVIAGKMGAWADKPGDFAEAVAAEGYQPGAYVPRQRFGEYLRKILRDAQASGLVTIVSKEAQSVERSQGGWSVGFADGSHVEGQALVLAQGNQAPETPPLARGISADLFVNDPWSNAGRDAITRVASSGGDVLIIGTGLTMVDVVLSLDEARHRGRIVAVSRRGLAPRAHADFEPAPVALDEVPKGSLTKLWRWLRQRGAQVGWRAAVDSLRPHSHALWQALTGNEHRRFMRHARPWWDVHRHRIAPEVAERIRRLIQLGQLEIVAGRIVDMWSVDQKLSVSIERRGRGEATEHKFEVAVNCTGPLGSISESKDALLTSLFAAGIARPDSLDIGLAVDSASRIAGADRAWAVGPLTKGKYWEITAVPDIRGQVAQVAEDITKELSNAVQS
jgi:uncharacterized NAD(P)/FAD-binding protein YdhS